jgi:hypothetical protein
VTRRWPALLAVVAVLAGLIALSADRDDPTPVTFGRAAAEPMPRADPTAALSSTWYCAGGTAQPDGFANLTVVVANVGDARRTGTVTWFPSGGDGTPTSVALEVGPKATTSLSALDTLEAPVVSALVELDGGEVAVEHAVTGPRGSGVAPCASEPSTRWYLANGTTERDSRQVLALFNPFPDDTVVDITTSTDEGRANPSKLQGLPVAAGTTTFVELGQFVRYRATTAVSVVARTGRLVVDRIQLFDGTNGRAGESLALAAPAPAEVWYFPEGLWQDGVDESWHVYNPTADEAQVSLEIVPDEGDAPEPYDVTIPPRTQLVIPADDDRVPKGAAHSSTIRSLNGVGVVAERQVDVRKPPAPRRGWSSALGAPLAARRWIFPVGEANDNTDEWIVAHNPGVRTVRVSVMALANGQLLPIEGLQDLPVKAAARLALRLGDHVSRTPLPIVVTATGGVAVERDAYAVGRTGVSTVIGIPAP